MNNFPTFSQLVKDGAEALISKMNPVIFALHHSTSFFSKQMLISIFI